MLNTDNVKVKNQKYSNWTKRFEMEKPMSPKHGQPIPFRRCLLLHFITAVYHCWLRGTKQHLITLLSGNGGESIESFFCHFSSNNLSIWIYNFQHFMHRVKINNCNCHFLFHLVNCKTCTKCAKENRLHIEYHRWAGRGTSGYQLMA